MGSVVEKGEKEKDARAHQADLKSSSNKDKVKTNHCQRYNRPED